MTVTPRQELPLRSERGSFFRDTAVPMPDGSEIRARLYVPRGRKRLAVVVGHGVHYQGIDEPRLIAFSRHLAAAGVVVLTPELPGLVDYSIRERARQALVSAVSWLAARGPTTEADGIGLIGFSFAGGIALLSATDPSLRNRLAYVAAIGGYHDLERSLRFLLTDVERTPSGSKHRKAHDYGLIVLVYRYIDKLVPAAERDTARSVFRAWLQERRGTAASLATERLSITTEALYERLLTEDLEAFRPELEGFIDRDAGTLRALSPRGKLWQVGVPIYLLHGAGDNVIPPSETRWAAAELRQLRGPWWQLPQPIGSGRALVTPLLTHITVGRKPGWLDELAFLDFMSLLV